MKNPNPKERTTSNNGSSITDNTFTAPEPSDFAIPNEIANTTKPTASSSATTGNKISVTGPFALYCLTTIKVAAGAVAVATAPSTIAAGKDNLSGIIKWRPISTTSTNKQVNNAWKTPIIVACFPIFLSWDKRNSFPIANAIKPRAKSEIRPNPSIWWAVIPIPSIPKLPSINGPINTPATRYAVTAGSWIFFASLDNIKPANKAIDKLKNILAVSVIINTPSFNIFNFCLIQSHRYIIR